MKKQKLVQAVVYAMLGMSASALASHSATTAPMEKCYGIVKAGKNDCGIPGRNACAAQVKEASNPKAWIFMPKGTCDKIVGGSTSAPK